MGLSPPHQCHESWVSGATMAPHRSHNSCTVHLLRSPRRIRLRSGCLVPEVRTDLVRPKSIPRYSRIPNYWHWGSTSSWPPGPTAVEVAAAAPTAAGVPTAPSRPGRPAHFDTGLPDPSSRGSDSCPSCCPSSDPMDHPGTSASWAQEPAPPGPRRQPIRKRIRPDHRPPARSCTAEPTVSPASPYPYSNSCPFRTDSTEV